ncbi:unnamed protein product [Gongylonema pulchrum]|uniref:Uncharacterized protein n=1 Tax=Gongylonema pulchrum TaxID=637853 RepID=A0A183DUC3_9BILA|nr:unnamed protein product [Gongylonema pulchrum]
MLALREHSGADPTEGRPTVIGSTIVIFMLYDADEDEERFEVKENDYDDSEGNDSDEKRMEVDPPVDVKSTVQRVVSEEWSDVECTAPKKKRS